MSDDTPIVPQAVAEICEDIGGYAEPQGENFFVYDSSDHLVGMVDAEGTPIPFDTGEGHDHGSDVYLEGRY